MFNENSFAINCYPNPFNGSTTIELKVQKDESVRVVIFNMSGNVVADLQEGELSQGIYDFRFDATQLPTGMYFGKVIVGNESHTLKLIAK